MRVQTLADFMTAGSTKPEWLLAEVLPRFGPALLVGPPFGGKTRLVAGLLAAAAAGEATFAGLALADRGGRPAVLVLAEHDDLSWRALFGAAMRGAGVADLHATIVRPPLDLADEETFRELLALVERLDPWIVVVDSIRSAATADENDSGSVAELMHRLTALAGGKRLVLALHHVGANGRARGSTHFAASAEAVLMLERRGDVLTVSVQSHDGPQRRITVRVIEDAAAGLRFAPGEEDAGDVQLDDAIASVLERGDLPTNKIAEALRAKPHDLHFDDDDLREALRGLEARGAVRKVGSGNRSRWSLVPGASSATSSRTHTPAPAPGPGPTGERSPVRAAGALKSPGRRTEKDSSSVAGEHRGAPGSEAAGGRGVEAKASRRDGAEVREPLLGERSTEEGEASPVRSSVEGAPRSPGSDPPPPPNPPAIPPPGGCPPEVAAAPHLRAIVRHVHDVLGVADPEQVAALLEGWRSEVPILARVRDMRDRVRRALALVEPAAGPGGAP